MPVRPQWSYGMQKNQLEQNENKMFQNYMTVRKNLFFIFEIHQPIFFQFSFC